MITRRTFVTGLLGLVLAGPLGSGISAAGDDRTLRMYNVQTDERIEVPYCCGGKHDAAALEEINHFLRCHYTNEVRPMDVAVLDLLCTVRDAARARGELHIVSGYRSPEYNAMLKRSRHRVSRNSLHIYGQAIDFIIPGLGSRKVSRIARSLSGGGVGQYPGFVHIDVGPVRHWKSS